MIASKHASLRPLIESKNGLHLTAYIRGETGVEDKCRQIQDAIETARALLHPVLSNEDVVRFLEPLKALKKNRPLLQRLRGSLGLFRKVDAFRILNLPLPVDDTCVIADTFHVKPLLRWLQIDREFLLFGFNGRSGSLYHGGLQSLQFIDAGLFHSDDEAVEWLNEWLYQISRKSEPRLFLAGEQFQLDRLLSKLRYPNVHVQPIDDHFMPESVPELARSIRTQLKAEARQCLEKALTEFHFAEEMNLAKKNLFQIAKAVIQGRVRKLIVADGIQIFGRVDRKTGGVSIHPAELDHEDDDILDDLAQMVLEQGGEVVVAERNKIPKGYPALAILKDSPSDIYLPFPTKEVQPWSK